MVSLTPLLPEVRHSDCQLLCKHQENTRQYACWYGCKHLERQPKKRHPNDKSPDAASSTNQESQ